ncbi:MAG: nucleotidyl transferase AbiEii/AbiGii toxin family protein [Bacteroidetes bacterium]|nr:nucleotidyl transferase AbiEii/AbiGii toxin family protein [Bacteroidota bacterium]
MRLLQIEAGGVEMLYEATVAKGTLVLIKQLCSEEILKDFRLVGGTALSLQIGHRISVDIDLFTRNKFDPLEVGSHLKDKYKAQKIVTPSNNVFTKINDVKIDMITHDYEWLKPPLIDEGVRMASLDDIAAMKVHAIAHVGTRMRDFADVYFILEHRSMDQILQAYVDKYPDLNKEIGRRALLYYEDIVKLDIHYMGKQVSWGDIEERLKKGMMEPDRKFSREEGPERPGLGDEHGQRRRGRT